MAHLIKTNKIFTAIGGEGASDSISFDGFYFLDFHGGQYDATIPADIFQSQSDASLSSAETGTDQIGQNGNGWAPVLPTPQPDAVSTTSTTVIENAPPAFGVSWHPFVESAFCIRPAAGYMGSFTTGASTTVNYLSADSLVTAGGFLPASISTPSLVTGQGPNDHISPAQPGLPSPINHAIAASGFADAFYPQSNLAAGTSSQTGAAKPVATIPQLADYLVNGFWQFAGEISHHWASSTITYNVNGLTIAEQFLAQSALNAWHEVANLTFVQTAGSANITFTHNGSMTAFESDTYNGSGILSSATINISAD